MKFPTLCLLVVGLLVAGCDNEAPPVGPRDGSVEVEDTGMSEAIDAGDEIPVPDSGEVEEQPNPEPDAGEEPVYEEDAGEEMPPDASEEPVTEPDGGVEEQPADTGPNYVEPDNCTTAEAKKIPDAPAVIFRWRAGAPAAANTAGTLTGKIETLPRPAGLAPFTFGHFEPTQYFQAKAAMASPTAGMTVQAWFRMDSKVTGYQTLFSNTESNRGYSLDLKDGRLFFLFSVNVNGTAKRYYVPDPADPANASLPRLDVTPGRWTHASVTVHKYSDRYFVRFMVNEQWAYSVNIPETAPLYNSTSFPVVGAESSATTPSAEGFVGDIHAVVVHNYAVDRDYSTAPAIRDGSAYFGLTAYHDYLGAESAGTATATPPFGNQTYSPNRRIWEADRNALWPAMTGRPRTRVTLPLLNDGYRPHGHALSADGRTLWLTYSYADLAGANPNKLADLLVAADLPGKTVRSIYRLTQSGANLTWKLGGLAEANGHLFFFGNGKVWRADPATATLEATANAELPGAPQVYALPVDPAAGYDVANPGPGLSYDAETNSIWLARHVTDTTQKTTLDRYALTADGTGIAKPSTTTSDERVEVPAGVRWAQGVVRLPGTKCFLVSSFDSAATPAAISKTPSAVYSYCQDTGALAKSAVLAPGVAGVALGHDQTAWVLFQGAAQVLQKRTSAEPLHDTLVPYVLGFAGKRLLPELGDVLPATTSLKVFRGDLHSHSSNSNDAAENATPPGSPAKCYARAKTRGLDFMQLTDHVTWGWCTDAEWAACQSQAKAANAATFVAGCSLETSIKITDKPSNHSNVFFYEGSWKDFSNFVGHASYFSKLTTKKGAIAQFNHPGSDRFLWTAPAPTAATDAQLDLLEFNGAPDDATRLKKYAEFLDKGWHVAPTWNSDSHSGSETAKSAFWMGSLTAAELKAAMVAHRSFVHNTHGDRGGTLRFYADAAWYGGIRHGYLAVPLRLVATHSGGIAKVDFIGPGGKVLRTVQCAGAKSCEKTELFAPPPKWVYLKATQTNGNFMVSAPAWFE